MGPPRSASAISSAFSGSGATRGRGSAGRAAAQRRASSLAGIARGRSTAVVTIRAPAMDGGRGQRGDDAVDVLVRHRGGHDGEWPVGEERPQIVQGRGERRRTRRVVGPIEQDLAPVGDDQLEASGPGGAGITRSTGLAIRAGDAGRLEGIEQGVRDGDVRGLVTAAQPDPGPAERRQVDDDPVAIPAEQRGRRDLDEGHAQAARPAPDDGRAPRRWHR